MSVLQNGLSLMRANPDARTRFAKKLSVEKPDHFVMILHNRALCIKFLVHRSFELYDFTLQLQQTLGCAHVPRLSFDGWDFSEQRYKVMGSIHEKLCRDDNILYAKLIDEDAIVLE